jgi:hypothetical protein
MDWSKFPRPKYRNSNGPRKFHAGAIILFCDEFSHRAVLIEGKVDDEWSAQGGNGDVTDEKILAFIQAHIRSVWAVEQMLVLSRAPERSWDVQELVRETRSSATAVHDALRDLRDAELISQTADGKYAFAPGSDELLAMSESLLKAYVERPRFVIQAIFSEPKDGLRNFADAFRLKKR